MTLNELLEKIETVQTDNGKLQILEDKDVDVILKMLADYYKTGEVSGKAYGINTGKQLTETTVS